MPSRRATPARREVRGHVAEAALEHGERAAARRASAAPARDRGRVAIEAEHPPGAGGEDRRAVAAAAEGGVEIDAVRAHRERGQHLGAAAPERGGRPAARRR